jgi:prepilin-type N-terminal cleavage/methylation domain-containing protein
MALGRFIEIMILPINMRPRRAFTLIEILVTIGILAVLVAMLLPQVKVFRQKAAVTKCTSNHRQITTAYLSYLSDNDNRLWVRPADTEWQNGSGGLYGTQGNGAPGQLCTLLEPYGLRRAAWSNYNAIPYRAQTVWYCPMALDKKNIAGHGATYYYRFLGNKLGLTKGPLTLAAVSDYISKTPYLRDYFGNHEHSHALYATSLNSKLVFSYLDGHSEYRQMGGEDQ